MSVLVALLLAASALAGSTTRAADSKPYLLGPDDQILIHVDDLDEISDKPVRIDPDGYLSLPLAGRIHAGGLSLEQLRQTLASDLAKYIDNPRITINVTDFESRPFSVLGEVNTPGVHALQGPKRLLDAISSAGGLKPDAGTTITITRQMQWGALPFAGAHPDASGQFSVASVSIDAITTGKSPLDNIDVQPNDVIEVSKTEVVYVLGEVKKAGGFSLGQHDGISLIRALSLAEGLSRDAAPKRALILRADSRAGAASSADVSQGTPVNVREILEGKTSDITLHPDDVLFIPNNVAGSAMRRAVEAALQIGTGVVIYR